jgi:hypothetical protein
LGELNIRKTELKVKKKATIYGVFSQALRGRMIMIRTCFRMSQICEKGSIMSRKIPSMITDSNQACLAKMVGRRVQEEANEISLCQFFKMRGWGELKGTPTSLHPGITLQVNNYWCKCAQKKSRTIFDPAL